MTAVAGAAPERLGPRAGLDGLERYHSPQVDVPVRLNTNEAPEPPPAAWRQALADEVARIEWQRYPDRRATALREAIAERHAVDPSWIFPANGSNEVIQSLCLAYGGPGRTAALFEPTYRLHSHIATVTATAVAAGARASDMALDLTEVRRVVGSADPAITFLCSPNNPTGMIDPAATVAEVAEMAPGLVVVDEAYGDFADWSALELVGEGRPVVVLRTYSKTWSMAAARLGYAVAPPDVVAVLERVALPYHLDAVTQAAGRLALRFEAEMRTRVASTVAERRRLVAGLAALPVDQWPSGANFVLFRPRGADGRAVWQGLLERGVLVRDCSSWPRLSGCLRVTVGTPDEDDAFLAALTEVLAT